MKKKIVIKHNRYTNSFIHIIELSEINNRRNSRTARKTSGRSIDPQQYYNNMVKSKSTMHEDDDNNLPYQYISSCLIIYP